MLSKNPRLTLHILTMGSPPEGVSAKPFVTKERGGDDIPPVEGGKVNEVEEEGIGKDEDLLGLVEGEDEDEEDAEDSESVDDEDVDGEEVKVDDPVYSDLKGEWVDARTEKESRERALKECKDTMRGAKKWRRLIRSINAGRTINRAIKRLSRDTYWGKEGVAETAIDSMTSYLSGTALGPDHPISWGTSSFEFWDNVRSARLASLCNRLYVRINKSFL
jgi:hypothetical protein